MTIYILDSDPSKIAEMLDDRSLNFMIKDIGQVLCNVHYDYLDGIHCQKSIYDADKIPLNYSDKLSICEWAAWSGLYKANYLYLVELGMNCCFEIEIHRRIRPNKYVNVIRWAKENIPDFPNYKYDGAEWETEAAPLSPLPLVMPKRYSFSQKDANFIDFYRNYYQAKLKKYIHLQAKRYDTTSHEYLHTTRLWTRRQKPDWINL